VHPEQIPAAFHSYQRHAETPARARADAAEFLAEHRVPDRVRCDVALLVSELTTNAVLHSGPYTWHRPLPHGVAFAGRGPYYVDPTPYTPDAVGVELSLSPDHVMIRVSDPSPAHPVVRTDDLKIIRAAGPVPAEAAGEGGHGMLIVQTTATVWGVQECHDLFHDACGCVDTRVGKSVWAALYTREKDPVLRCVAAAGTQERWNRLYNGHPAPRAQPQPLPAPRRDAARQPRRPWLPVPLMQF